MVKVHVLLSGETIFESQLDAEKEYILGRNPHCEIPLPKKKGISRSHAKIFYTEDSWTIEVLSQFGEIKYNNESHNILHVKEDCSLYIHPFEIKFIFENKNNSLEDSKTTPIDNPSKTEIIPLSEKFKQSDSSSFHKTSLKDVNSVDATMVAPQNISFYMKIEHANHKKETLILTGDFWVGGRDPDCEIHIDEEYISRKHFELSKEDHQLFILDLNSSNGIKINGKKIPPQEKILIHPEDTLQIKKTRFQFEAYDESYKEKIKHLPENNLPSVSPSTIDSFNAPLELNSSHDEPVVERIDGLEQHISKKKVKIALLVLAPLLIFGLFFNDPPKNSKKLASQSKGSKVQLALTKEQDKLIRDSLRLARSQYNREQFSLCLSELKKIHEIIPSYEDSKKLQRFCENGLHLAQELENKKRIERERKLTEQRIQSIIAKCKAQIDSFKNIDELNTCLSEAIELSPEDFGIEELRTYISQKENKIKESIRKKQLYESKVKAGLAHYMRAKRLYKSGNLNKALKEYYRYLGLHYPDPKNKRPKALREVASIKKSIHKKVISSLKKCERELNNNNYKESFKACNKALSEDTKNQKALKLKQTLLLRLSREMKRKFDDASIEENYGNVEAAKELWHQIIKKDFPGGSQFYQKAKNKLKLYEVLN